ncbi:P-loop containing nucleoside triphosphate hydrolase protein [Xylaria scruposa]|nr:P-loop containing nucleoside triphosphate hydrolase protein [Xylaria scruposa]
MSLLVPASGEAIGIQTPPPSEQPCQRDHVTVCFSNLDCYGSKTSAQVQETFFSYLITWPKFLLSFPWQRRNERSQILYNLHGIIHPGEMLLVLGPPGSGCTTLLKTIAQQTDGIHLGGNTKITYRGLSVRPTHTPRIGNLIYLAEHDVHFPELTLGQTLNFAVSTQRSQSQSTSDAGNAIASSFGLGDVFNTKVGDAIVRGISGGERRRTSIAETFIAGAAVQCWDNCTRGLDSWTANHLVRLLGQSVHQLKTTLCMSLYQASERIYNEFDKVLLLYEGHQIFFGPNSDAADYFLRLGFSMPDRSTTADFLTSITSPSERTVREGYENRVPRVPEEFAAAWQQSRECQVLLEEIHRSTIDSSGPLEGTNQGSKQPIKREKSRLAASSYKLPATMQVKVCLQRAFQRAKNNMAPLILGVLANSILGIVVGSAFYDLGDSAESIRPRSIVLFFALMVNAFAPAIEVSLMWTQRPIVEKHKRYGFYRPYAERLASLICDLPSKVAIGFGIHLPLYFLSNLRRSPSAFFTYWLLMFANIITMSMVFRTIGSISKTREETMTPASILVLLCTIYTGFVVPAAYMVPWFSWFRYLNPLTYTYESLMINEFRSRQFPCLAIIPDGPAYSQIEARFRTCALMGGEAGKQEINGTLYLDLKYGFQSTHLWRNLAILLALAIAFCLFHLLAAEYVLARPKRGDTLIFRNKVPQKERNIPDEELGRSQFIRLACHKGTSDKSVHNLHDMGQHLPQKAATIHWENLTYQVKTKNGTRNILTDVSGWVRPGTLTTLMGVTGAGKTTLLDLLADRISSGQVSGAVYINGNRRDKQFRSRIGYVQQDDIHLSTATVREALLMSAMLRQPRSISKQEKEDYVTKIIKLMDMAYFADAVVGRVGEGLNIEQRKRLSIAVEMVARPDILLFLDEPTSGLDSQTAWSICALLRQLADHGQTIMCTIHQPSSQILMMFDRLLLLDRCGQVLYFGDLGPNSSTMISYFELAGAPACGSAENPAEWVLDVTGNRQLTFSNPRHPQLVDWAKHWTNSEQNQQILKELKTLRVPKSRDGEASSSSNSRKEFAASYMSQMLLVSRRIFQEQWRDPIYLYCKISLSIGLSLFNGLSFFRVPLDIQGITSLLFSIFLITHLFSSIDRLIITKFISGRELFECRERDSKTYSWVIFVASNILVELLWQTIVSVPVFATWYYPTGLYRLGNITFSTSQRSGLILVLIWLFNLWAATLSQVFAALMSQDALAMQLATLSFWLSLVFCGVLVPPDSLPSFWIFLYRVSPLTYFVGGIAVAAVSNSQLHCSEIETLKVSIPENFGGGAQSCEEYLAQYINATGGYLLNPSETNADCQYCPVSNTDIVLETFGINPSYRWRPAGLMVIYVVFNILATFIAYYYARVPRRVRALKTSS